MYRPQLAPSLYPYADPFLRNTSQVGSSPLMSCVGCALFVLLPKHFTLRTCLCHAGECDSS